MSRLASLQQDVRDAMELPPSVPENTLAAGAYIHHQPLHISLQQVVYRLCEA